MSLIMKTGFKLVFTVLLGTVVYSATTYTSKPSQTTQAVQKNICTTYELLEENQKARDRS